MMHTILVHVAVHKGSLISSVDVTVKVKQPQVPAVTFTDEPVVELSTAPPPLTDQANVASGPSLTV